MSISSLVNEAYVCFVCSASPSRLVCSMLLKKTFIATMIHSSTNVNPLCCKHSNMWKDLVSLMSSDLNYRNLIPLLLYGVWLRIIAHFMTLLLCGDQTEEQGFFGVLQLWWFWSYNSGIARRLTCAWCFFSTHCNPFGMTIEARTSRHCLNLHMHISLMITFCFCMLMRRNVLGMM